jgi:hypothetical protein
MKGMNMKRLLFALAPLALSLSGCAPMLAALSGLPSSPQAVANKTTLDEKGSISLEAMYTGLALVGTLSYRSGAVKPSANPAVQRDDFCPRIIKREITPTDKGMELAAVECKLRLARDTARSAYDAANQAQYDKAYDQGLAAYEQGIALIRSN